MAHQPCYAPVFSGSSAFVCFLKAIYYTFLLLLLIIILMLSAGNKSVFCAFRRASFRIQKCRKGNSDPTINLTPDPYERHVRAYKNLYGKDDTWEQWMLDNRNRYENAFTKASQRPNVLDIAFRYDTNPIAYNPPWTNEAEHMAALEALAEPAYADSNFNFIFNGDTSASYANVIAGIPTNSSHATGKDVYLYFEGIFNHEFAHVMGVLHHYDTPAQTGTGQHMPPGETTCIMDRNSNQFCSACRTALHIPLDVDNQAAIDAAVANINDRYPY